MATEDSRHLAPAVGGASAGTVESLRPGARCRVAAASGARLTERSSIDSAFVRQLATDALVVCAEVRVEGDGLERARIASPAGWLDTRDLEFVGPARGVSLDWDTFLERHLETGPGDHYGLAFPISLDALREAGAEFLTAAFHASGVLATDNRVTKLTRLDSLEHNGASDAALLSVEYATPSPGLHEDLFVKVSPPDLQRKFTVAAMAQGEVAINRRTATGPFPVPVARYYFGDYCGRTSNFLLITERIPFGRDPIEPAWSKGYEQHVPEVVDHYRALAASLARVVAAHKCGALGDDVEETFPFVRASRGFPPIDGAEAKLDWLVDFIGRVAPQLFVDGSVDAAFLARWREDVLFGLEHQREIGRYLVADVDYTGLCHPNLNIDNAWYWRDTEGDLRTGWLDLGGFGQMSLAQALNSMPMMSEPERYASIRSAILETFVTTCGAEGGPALDPEELRLQYTAAVLSVSLGLIVGSAEGFLSQVAEGDFATMSDWRDPRLQESGLAAGIVWIDNVLRRWREERSPGDAWREIVSRRAS